MNDDVVAALIRWADGGAFWRVTSRTSGFVTVALYGCDGGEEKRAYPPTT